LTILEHDIVFFFGDFNYRMDEEVSKEDVFRLSELPDAAWATEG
jgi:predicted phosphohydrolase